MCIPQLRLRFHPASRIDVAFDAPHLSSDGGLLLVRQLDERLGLTERFARLLPDERDQSRVLHDRHEQVRQRVFQVVLGYEDCNDATRLRHDPMHKVACDLEPRGSRALSSQPTLSRFENAFGMRTIRSLMLQLEQDYVDRLAEDTPVVVLDIDSTDDPTHGSQQLSFFHGYYDQHMFHPVLVFDGLTGQLITAVLRPGNSHAARGAGGVLRRLVRSIKQRLPNALVCVRGDSGFCVPRILTMLEQLDGEHGGVDYLFGIARNPRLERALAPYLERSACQATRCGGRARVFASFDYAASTWPHARPAVGKAEHLRYGPNPRFVLTSLANFPPRLLYDAYCERGQAENFIKDFKLGLNADRLSCHRFEANFFRLLLHVVAYRLMHALREAIAQVDPDAGRHEFRTLRARVLKVAVLVRQSVRRILLRMPAAFPMAATFAKALQVLGLPEPVT